MLKKKVSILIPFKNTENYLNECLDSIVKQSYVNWEVICVNDHSIDSSLEIANKFALSNPKIKVVNNKGNGLIDALQTAYNLSTGDLITRMDSDDIMLTNKISSMAEDLLNFGTGHIALGMVKYFSEKELGNGYKNYETWLNSLTSKGLNFNEIYKECVIPSPCWMVHRDDLEKVNNFESKIYPEDYDLAFRFYQIGLNCIKSNKVLHMWRDYPNRTSRTNSNYADNSFLKLKINYFLKLSYNENKKLVVWGAGKKGKKVAYILNELRVSFLWICDNPKKIGKKIYENYLEDWQIISNLSNYQSIITIANPEAQNFIKSFFKKKNKVELVDYFFFC
jgi:glycosyltransferase involved in cell wall biosynthesis